MERKSKTLRGEHETQLNASGLVLLWYNDGRSYEPVDRGRTKKYASYTHGGHMDQHQRMSDFRIISQKDKRTRSGCDKGDYGIVYGLSVEILWHIVKLNIWIFFIGRRIAVVIIKGRTRVKLLQVELWDMAWQDYIGEGIGGQRACLEEENAIKGNCKEIVY